MKRKDHILKILPLLLLLSLGALSNAQHNILSNATTFGVTIPLKDNGIGFHIGVNPSYRIAPVFSVEGQISYLYTKISSSFSGTEGVNNAMNILAGGRVYLIPESRRTRVYLNLLAGGNWSKDSVTGVETYGEFGFGFSGGGYVEINRFLAGLSYDTPQNLVLKVGYIF